MERIRMSGNDQLQKSITINCNNCGLPIVTKGEPMTPIYYHDTETGASYCKTCGHPPIPNEISAELTETVERLQWVVDNPKSEHVEKEIKQAIEIIRTYLPHIKSKKL